MYKPGEGHWGKLKDNMAKDLQKELMPSIMTRVAMNLRGAISSTRKLLMSRIRLGRGEGGDSLKKQ